MCNRNLGIFFIFAILAGSSCAAPSADCDKQCLIEAMDQFVDEMTRNATTTLPISPVVEVRENALPVGLEATAWVTVERVRSRVTFADPVTGNVVSRSGVELSDGRPGYISTRIKVFDGTIIDVELSSDTADRVVASYVYNLQQRFDEPIPVEQHSSRADLEVIARRYFQNLTDHSPRPEDHIDSCNRYHSGQQITNVESNTVEEGGSLTCLGAIGGNPPWGPAVEQRFPVIDPDSGIVFGVTLETLTRRRR